MTGTSEGTLKRGRGRPRKHPLRPEDTPQPKRGRGRPRKRPPLEQTGHHPKLRRGRSRKPQPSPSTATPPPGQKPLPRVSPDPSFSPSRHIRHLSLDYIYPKYSSFSSPEPETPIDSARNGTGTDSGPGLSFSKDISNPAPAGPTSPAAGVGPTTSPSTLSHPINKISSSIIPHIYPPSRDSEALPRAMMQINALDTAECPSLPFRECVKASPELFCTTTSFAQGDFYSPRPGSSQSSVSFKSQIPITPVPYSPELSCTTPTVGERDS